MNREKTVPRGTAAPLLASLRARLLLLVFVALAPAFALVAWLHYADLESDRAEVAAAVSHIVASRALEFGEKIEDTKSLLAIIAGFPTVKEDASLPRCSAILAEMKRELPHYANLGVARAADGLHVCSAVPFDPAKKLNALGRLWYQRALETRGFAIGEYQIGRITGLYTINFGRPVIDAKGEIAGVAFAALDLAWLSDFVSGLPLPPDAALTVLDRSGRILARHPGHAAWVGERHPQAERLLSAAAAKAGSIETTGIDGVVRQYAIAPVPGTDGALTVVFGQSKAVAEAAARQYFSASLAAMTAILLAAFAFAWLAAEGLVLRRSRRLTESAERLAGGDLEARSGVAGADEIGRLAAAFDRMADAVAERERGLERANRALRVLSGSNRALLRAQSEQELLDEACRIAVETGGYRMAWVGYAEHDEAKSVRPMAWNRSESEFVQALRVSWGDNALGRGPSGTAIRTGKACVVHSVREDPAVAPWREAALARGFSSAVSLPLRLNGEVAGVLGICAAEADAFDGEEIELLTELADDLVFGIRTLRMREQKARAEEALREADQRLRFALETCQIGAWDLNLSDHTAFRSPEHDRIFGYPEPLPEWTLDDFFRHALPEYHEPIREMVAEATAARTGWTYECRIRRADGEIRWIWFTGRYFTDTAGRDRVAGVVQDITDRKQAEAAQAETDAAQRANRMKSEFLASMSHELRTPLNAIVGFSELLRDGLAGEVAQQQRECLQDILSSGNHLLSLINDILDLSKVEAGKMELEPESIPVESLLSMSLSIVREKAAAHRLALGLDVAADAGEICADARKVKQIAYNLLSNAVKFTPDGGRVTVAARRVPANSVPPEAAAPDGTLEFLEIAVADTGIGVSPEDQAKLFSAFTQIDSSLSRQYEGTGLGLALVKRLVQLHGGASGVESAPGKGSTFRVWLPYRPMIECLARQRSETKEIIPSGRRVLVVEDDPAAAELLRLALEQAGFRVTSAASAAAARERLEAETPDLITLDIILPGEDGWQFLDWMKRSARWGNIPVVVVSIVAEERKGLALGASAVLQKPFLKDEFARTLAGIGFTPSQGAHVLVVDDDPLAVEHMALLVEGEGCAVERASGGHAGLSKALAAPPDLILLDLMMPDLSGFEVVTALRADLRTLFTPVIIVTSKALDAEDRRALNGHVQAIVQKSGFSSETFLAEVRRALATRKNP